MPRVSGSAFEWDQSKSDACFRDRGFDFAYVVRAFFDPCGLVNRDDRRTYPEERFRLTGEIDGRIFVVVYCVRQGVVRIISARKANRREVIRHERGSLEA